MTLGTLPDEMLVRIDVCLGETLPSVFLGEPDSLLKSQLAVTYVVRRL